MSAEGAVLATLRGAAVGYEGEIALRGLDMEVRAGELIGVVGPSGCGKTTLLRALIGDVEAYGGVIAQGTRPDGGSLRVSYVPQVETVDWNFPITVEQVVLLGLWRERRWLPWVSSGERERVRAVLEEVGIADLAGRSIRALSGGQQQRAFLARALVSEPDLLLLDEPTNGLDIKTQHEILHELDVLNDSGVAIVLTTHDLNGVASHLPRLICLGERTLLADGSADEVLVSEVLERAYGQPVIVVRSGRERYVLPVPEEAPGAHGEDEEPAGDAVELVGRIADAAAGTEPPRA